MNYSNIYGTTTFITKPTSRHNTTLFLPKQEHHTTCKSNIYTHKNTTPHVNVIYIHTHNISYLSYMSYDLYLYLDCNSTCTTHSQSLFSYFKYSFTFFLHLSPPILFQFYPILLSFFIFLGSSFISSLGLFCIK